MAYVLAACAVLTCAARTYAVMADVLMAHVMACIRTMHVVMVHAFAACVLAAYALAACIVIAYVLMAYAVLTIRLCAPLLHRSRQPRQGVERVKSQLAGEELGDPRKIQYRRAIFIRIFCLWTAEGNPRKHSHSRTLRLAIRT